MIRIEQYRRRVSLLERPQHTSELLDALEWIAGVLDEDTWMLGGGVSAALTLGTFYREHSDLDLVIHVDHLPVVYEKLRLLGYRLYTRKAFNHGNLGLLLFLPTHPGGKLLAKRPKRLCLFRPSRFQRNPYLKKLDLYLFAETEKHYLTLDTSTMLPKNYPVVGYVYSCQSGRSVRCLHLGYVSHFKTGRTSPKHRADLVAIEEGVDAVETLFLPSQ